MRAFRTVMQLFDAYGSLWLAITAAIGVAYLYSPTMVAVEQHERRAIENWRDSIPAFRLDTREGPTFAAR
jgi:hypothetical protein